MDNRPHSGMTRQEPEEEVRMLRAALARIDGKITTTDIFACRSCPR